MRISKFDLYNIEWLDLVFENRNKAYGAYELRQSYAGTMARAMGITFLSVSLLFGAYFIFHTQVKYTRAIVVTNDPNVIKSIKPIEPPIKKVTPPAAKPLKPDVPAKPIATVKNVPLIVKPDPDAQQPVKTAELEHSAIGTETSKGVPDAGNALPAQPQGGGEGTVPDTKIHGMGEGLDVMPEPVGGAAAWSKFLQKNLRFPAAAQDEGLSGKVWVSFVIEKDGSLSNVVVEKAAGHGFDEEAARVIKLAKPWKPGQQNGQPVRVRYIIPINFQSTSND
jgi:protein TonB